MTKKEYALQSKACLKELSDERKQHNPGVMAATLDSLFGLSPSMVVPPNVKIDSAWCCSNVRKEMATVVGMVSRWKVACLPRWCLGPQVKSHPDPHEGCLEREW